MSTFKVGQNVKFISWEAALTHTEGRSSTIMGFYKPEWPTNTLFTITNIDRYDSIVTVTGGRFSTRRVWAWSVKPHMNLPLSLKKRANELLRCYPS